MRRAESSEITIGSGASPPAGPHCAVAAAFTLVWDGSPSTGANCRSTGAWYRTLTVPEDCCVEQPWVENASEVAFVSLSTAKRFACDCASLGCCLAQDCAPASA